MYGRYSIPVFATNYYKAKEYLSIAISRPIIPDVVKKSYDKYDKGTNEETSRNLIDTIYQTTTSETTKKIIRQNEVITNLTKALEKLVTNYKTMYGVYPSTLQEMIDKKFLYPTPLLEKEFTITINNETGVVVILPNDTPSK